MPPGTGDPCPRRLSLSPRSDRLLRAAGATAFVLAPARPTIEMATIRCVARGDSGGSAAIASPAVQPSSWRLPCDEDVSALRQDSSNQLGPGYAAAAVSRRARASRLRHGLADVGDGARVPRYRERPRRRGHGASVSLESPRAGSNRSLAAARDLLEASGPPDQLRRSASFSQTTDNECRNDEGGGAERRIIAST